MIRSNTFLLKRIYEALSRIEGKLDRLIEAKMADNANYSLFAPLTLKNRTDPLSGQRIVIVPYVLEDGDVVHVREDLNQKQPTDELPRQIGEN